MNDKAQVTPEDMAKFLAGQTPELYQRQAKRKELPVGQYIRFVVEPNSESLATTKRKEDGTGGDLYLKFSVVPLRDPNDGDSAALNLKTNHMMFPPKAAQEGEEEFSNLYVWEQFFQAVGYQRKDGVPPPARGEYNRSTKTYWVDGVEVPREDFVKRNEGERAEWMRGAVVDLFKRIAEGESPLAELAFYAKCAKSEDGAFTNIQTSKKKGGGPILGELPKTETYAEF